MPVMAFFFQNSINRLALFSRIYYFKKLLHSSWNFSHRAVTHKNVDSTSD